jgi:uncharacterized membrane protein YgdD (TMEM256/DUF423 family)
MMKTSLAIIALFGGITVIMGAIGSHALKETLSNEDMQSYNTAVYYQMTHLIVLLALNISNYFSPDIISKVNWIFAIGILLFSGSIYLFKFTSLSPKTFWYVTPLGGFTLIGGWFTLAYFFLKQST